MIAERREALDQLYGSIDRLREQLGGSRRLEDATGDSGWPEQGIYLFFETGELREDGQTPRVVHVGAPALTATSRTALWQRLSQHRGQVAGTSPGGGDHRGSAVRYHVGTALIARDGWPDAAQAWGKGSHVGPDVRAREADLEHATSQVIRRMPLLWLDVPEQADRGSIVRDVVALLSNADRDPVDPPSARWLGRYAERPEIRRSGLWNVDHVHEQPTGAGLARFRELVETVAPAGRH
jgi:hypothetical protein